MIILGDKNLMLYVLEGGGGGVGVVTVLISF